jgi:hypothetical protein
MARFITLGIITDAVSTILSQVPTIVLIVFVCCVFGVAALALVNESACSRLIRILRVLIRNDNTPKRKRR